jgi:hypothetical protein
MTTGNEEDMEEQTKEGKHEDETNKTGRSTDLAPEPLRADVREAFRHTHHTKSTPEWSVPTKMYVVAEEQLVRPIQQLWKKWEKKMFTQTLGKYKKLCGFLSQEAKEIKFTKEEASPSWMEEPKDI